MEQLIIKGKADSCGMTLSNYLRSRGMSLVIKPRLSEDDIQVFASLAGFSENFREIVKYLQSIGDVSGLAEQIMLAQKEIRSLLDKLK